MATPILIGATIAGAAYAGRFLIRAVQRARNSQAFFEANKKTFSLDHMAEGFEPKMSKEEAESILGLENGATKEQIKVRHKLLIIKNHPDKGGSSYLATKINEAKNVLSTQKQQEE